MAAIFHKMYGVEAVETIDLCVSWDYAAEWLQNGSKRPRLSVQKTLLGDRPPDELQSSQHMALQYHTGDSSGRLSRPQLDKRHRQSLLLKFKKLNASLRFDLLSKLGPNLSANQLRCQLFGVLEPISASKANLQGGDFLYTHKPFTGP
ncbi:hypothetical protein NC652_000411 [Populus alba x Populus x berolinensis]|nr:hypothetical protein NC652_000411 [Populus alba x Populus x berolinensis]